MMSIQALFGVAAGILQVVAGFWYVRSIVRGETKPNRVTWWIIALVNGMIAVSYFAAGARATIWLPAVYAASFAVIGVLSLKYGEGPVSLNAVDRISLGGALASAVVWAVVRSPVPALFMNMATEFIGLVPTINKSYRRPWTENRVSWILATFASLLNVFAIGEWTVVIALYPIYVFITNLIITCFILRRKNA